MVNDMDSFDEARIWVRRRVGYALNTLAVQDDRLPPEGPFDAAAANGLAAILAQESPEEVHDKSGRVKAPLALADAVIELDLSSLDPNALEALKDGVKETQPYRHARADEEWPILTKAHKRGLTHLDAYSGLQVIDRLRGLTVDDAIMRVWEEVTDDELPFDLKDRLSQPEPAMCDVCTRMTMISLNWDDWGISNGPGQCVACGYERTEDDVMSDAIEFKMNEP